MGSFAANPFDLHDMHGNVFEWTQDCYHFRYNGAPNDGSARTGGDCTTRVLRGGSWDIRPASLRSAERSWIPPSVRNEGVGFRLAQDL